MKMRNMRILNNEEMSGFLEKGIELIDTACQIMKR